LALRFMTDRSFPPDVTTAGYSREKASISS